MIEHKNIQEAILGVMNEVGYVQKIKTGGLNYSFAGEAALIAALRPTMIEHGIFAHVLSIVSQREQYTTKSGTPMMSSFFIGSVRFVHAPSNTHIDVFATGEGADAGDKSANKAATGLLKYALRQTFLIETGDDPENSQPEQRAAKTGKAEAKELTVKEAADKYAVALGAYSQLVDRAEAVGITTEPLPDNITIDELREIYGDLLSFVNDATKQENK